MGFVNEKAADGKWQTIDKARNIILTKVSGPDQEGFYSCELEIEGKSVKFFGVSGMKIHGEPQLVPRRYELNWKFHKLYIHEDIQMSREEVKAVIAEALTVYGDSFNTEKAASVSVEFYPNA
ncbi:MAG: hypothetical protein LRZ85_02990 [Alphaproteobacteria bacterium]|nr:hypothetical protein [Alphaproteobacteria bacterium]MCD8520074.1 hypothetical protein [Alphaproteobacteria bacterium]MCD8526542.1 hypothetical protein [Alphaproteobacteria bacterium]MCD8571345.1 hypothetical protein [Alphaproteobacteria bacterium]